MARSNAWPAHAGINQKYEMRPAEFRYIYGGGQFNDTHSRSRVIVNISIRSTPTTHAYADKPCNQRCFMRVQGAFDSAMRRASCCHLFAHYITLLPSRVSPANLHYKCRWCYHRFAYTLWRRWRIVNGGRAIVHVYVSAYDAAVRECILRYAPSVCMCILCARPAPRWSSRKRAGQR